MRLGALTGPSQSLHICQVAGRHWPWEIAAAQQPMPRRSQLVAPLSETAVVQQKDPQSWSEPRWWRIPVHRFLLKVQAWTSEPLEQQQQQQQQQQYC
jgi:hypothetical protein